MRSICQTAGIPPPAQALKRYPAVIHGDWFKELDIHENPETQTAFDTTALVCRSNSSPLATGIAARIGINRVSILGTLSELIVELHRKSVQVIDREPEPFGLLYRMNESFDQRINGRALWVARWRERTREDGGPLCMVD